jgi:hypothetical protein
VLSLDATAALLGDACVLEGACFEVLGGWVGVPEPAVQLMVARHSRHHGDHAVRLAELLPRTRAHDPTAILAGADPRWRSAIALVRSGPDTPTLDRLAGLYQALLPALLARYDRAISAASPWSDGPLTRALRGVADEERGDLAEGLAALERLAADGGDADRVARRRAEVEAALPAGGPEWQPRRLGPVP